MQSFTPSWSNKNTKFTCLCEWLCLYSCLKAHADLQNVIQCNFVWDVSLVDKHDCSFCQTLLEDQQSTQSSAVHQCNDLMLEYFTCEPKKETFKIPTLLDTSRSSSTDTLYGYLVFAETAVTLPNAMLVPVTLVPVYRARGLLGLICLLACSSSCRDERNDLTLSVKWKHIQYYIISYYETWMI